MCSNIHVKNAEKQMFHSFSLWNATYSFSWFVALLFCNNISMTYLLQKAIAQHCLSQHETQHERAVYRGMFWMTVLFHFLFLFGYSLNKVHKPYFTARGSFLFAFSCCVHLPYYTSFIRKRKVEKLKPKLQTETG